MLRSRMVALLAMGDRPLVRFANATEAAVPVVRPLPDLPVLAPTRRTASRGGFGQSGDVDPVPAVVPASAA